MQEILEARDQARRNLCASQQNQQYQQFSQYRQSWCGAMRLKPVAYSHDNPEIGTNCNTDRKTKLLQFRAPELLSEVISETATRHFRQAGLPE